MTATGGGEGFAVLCDGTGTVRRVLCGRAGEAAPGVPLTALLDPPWEPSLGGFLAALAHQRLVLDWEPEGAAGSGVRLSGIRIDGDCCLVVAAPERTEMTRLVDDLMRINNEQTNALRDAGRRLARRARKEGEDDARLYEELTRVNNDLVNLQRELTKANTQLAHLNRQKNQFLGMAAHDLRSPLGVVLTYSEFLEDEAAAVLNPDQMAFVQTIRNNCHFMLRVIDDLLDVSSIEAGQLNLNRVSGSLEALVRGHLPKARALAAKKDIALELELGQPLPDFPFDADKLQQVLTNLVDNAIKFSHPGGVIRVGLGRDGDWAELTVQDQGVGMNPTELSGLFQPYGSPKKLGTAGEKSTGLGLAIVKRIVTGHGGEVDATATPGAGTRIRVRLRLCDRATGVGGVTG